jgi:16S rRNA (cytosine967-C5)-methyltransferase
MPQPGLPARRAAVHLLDQVLGDGRLLSEAIGSGVLERLEPADRATAQRLATETLRGLERVDRILQKHLQKYPPITVRNALRIGAYELCTGGAAHGVVNSFVEFVSRNKRHGSMKGLVNAVLRKVAANGAEIYPTLRTPRLPKWIRGPLVEAYSPEIVAAIEEAHFAGAALDLTAKSDQGALQRATEGTLLPTGSVRLTDAGQVSILPGYKKGTWWVQDAAAAIPAMVLAAKAGESVLELCAAPGGKTMQIAASGATPRAVDNSAGRMERVAENLKRAKLEAELIVGDALDETGQWDAILLDAPCSATGTIRRHPDLPHAKDGSEFFDLFALQSQMLDHAVHLLKPGGRLVYCTCSLLPDEGESQIEDLLARHSGLSVDRTALDIEGVDPAWQTEEGGLRLRPDYWADKGGMDGFYIACIRKG